jgi:hypothetical protein
MNTTDYIDRRVSRFFYEYNDESEMEIIKYKITIK